MEFKKPIDAQRHGIAAIYQHVTCYPHLSVTENIFIGHEKTRKITGRIDWKSMHSQAQHLLDQLDANFSSKDRMGDISIARQQIVEIAKALSADARIIIMDEPTAALSRHESEELYRITEDLRDKGTSIIFISHRLEDINRLADRITVLRDSRYIGNWDKKELSQEKLISAMVGREITQMFPKRQVNLGGKVLEVKNLSRTGFFKDLSFDIKKGEVVALTGLVGAGRTEICETIYGIHPADKGTILVDGKPVNVDEPCKALQAGIGYLPEDRQLQGLILPWSISHNITLPSIKRYAKWFLINKAQEWKTAADLAGKLQIKTPNVFAAASTLSGGNQQKVVVAKILVNELKVIILDEPTKGVDIGAKAAIYEIIGELAEQGYGILMVSSEMPEVLGLSDRIVVVREGHMTAFFDTAKASQEQILRHAMGTDEHSAPSKTAVLS